MFTSMLLAFAFNAIKSETTRISENRLFQVLALYTILEELCRLNLKFGDAAVNPALSSFYIMFEISQYQTPNRIYDSY